VALLLVLLKLLYVITGPAASQGDDVARVNRERVHFVHAVHIAEQMLRF
jgi:hypothetical protein